MADSAGANMAVSLQDPDFLRRQGMAETPSPATPEKPTDYTMPARDLTDDATPLDDLVEQNAFALQPDTLPQHPTGEASAPVTAPGNDRLLTGTLVLSVGWDAQRLFVADSERYEIHLWAASDTPTDYVFFGDENSKVFSQTASGILYSGQEIILRRYTGPLWIGVPSAGVTGPITVTFAAVTK